MKSETLQHGVNHIGKPFRIERSWRRNDIYVSNSDGSKHHETRACAGPDDQSGLATISGGGFTGSVSYNADCPCCFLNHSHTVDYHNRAVRLHAEAVRQHREAANAVG